MRQVTGLYRGEVIKLRFDFTEDKSLYIYNNNKLILYVPDIDQAMVMLDVLHDVDEGNAIDTSSARPLFEKISNILGISTDDDFKLLKEAIIENRHSSIEGYEEKVVRTSPIEIITGEDREYLLKEKYADVIIKEVERRKQINKYKFLDEFIVRSDKEYVATPTCSYDRWIVSVVLTEENRPFILASGSNSMCDHGIYHNFTHNSYIEFILDILDKDDSGEKDIFGYKEKIDW